MQKLIKFLQLPALIVGALVAIGMGMHALGVKLELPGEQLEQIKIEQVVVDTRQDSALNAHDLHHDWEEEHSDSLELSKDSSRQRRTDLIEAQGMLIEKALRGECLENTFERLVLQDLIENCREWGIPRSPGDAIDQRLTQP
jgi:hypothetical protein